MQYGTVQGRFLSRDGNNTPLTGRIIFTPVNTLSEPGADYPLGVPITGYLNGQGELKDRDGGPLQLAYGQWQADFRLKWNGFSVPIRPLSFHLESDSWITQVPGSGWEFEVVPLGDGTADLISQNIIDHKDGTATLKIG